MLLDFSTKVTTLLVVLMIAQSEANRKKWGLRSEDYMMDGPLRVAAGVNLLGSADDPFIMAKLPATRAFESIHFLIEN